jgi:hypothetical protein
MMLEILQFYVSGFWVWAGITIGVYTIGACLVMAVSAWRGK